MVINFISYRFRGSFFYYLCDIIHYLMKMNVILIVVGSVLLAVGVGGAPDSPEKFYLIPLDTLSRFKRVGHKFLPHYIIENPRQNLRNHMHDWFYNDVFKKKNYNK